MRSAVYGWLFDTWLRECGLMGSEGNDASAYDTALMASSSRSMKVEVCGTGREGSAACGQIPYVQVHGFKATRPGCELVCRAA